MFSLPLEHIIEDDFSQQCSFFRAAQIDALYLFANISFLVSEKEIVITAAVDQGFIFKTLEAYPSTTLLLSFRRDRVERLRVFRSLGYLWQRIFVEEYDTHDMSWVFNCDKGYSMVIPAGWQLDLWPDTPDSAPVDSDLRKRGLEPCIYMNNGIGEDLTDTVCVAICTFSSQRESVPLDKKVEWFRTVVSSAAESGKVEIHREGAVSYCAVPIGAGKEYNYFAMAALPEKTVYLMTLPFNRKYLDTVRRALPAMVSSVELTE